MHVINRLLICSLFLMSIVSKSDAQGWVTLYVDSSAAAGGDGLNKNSPFNNLDDAFSSNLADSIEVHIAKGTYYPNDLSKSFNLRKLNARIIGGYSKDFTSIHDTNRVILSGDIDTNDVMLSDSTVVINGTNSEVVLRCSVLKMTIENVTIQNGYSLTDYGAALHITGQSLTTINNCRFYSNHAFRGGALYYTGDSITITECKFSDNISYDTVYIFDNSGIAGGGAVLAVCKKILIDASVFTRCQSGNVGGAICAVTKRIISNNNEYKWNRARSEGGAIFSLVDTLETGNDLFAHCHSGGSGGAISTHTRNLLIQNNIIENNSAADSGGGLFALANKVKISNTKFNNDSASNGGGAFCYVDELDLDSVAFENNLALSRGGAIAAGSDSSSIRDCNFLNNRSGNKGGAFWGGSADKTCFHKTNFNGNRADSSGGAIFIDWSTLILSSGCKFINNKAGFFGGAICSDFLQPGRIDTVFANGVLFENDSAAYGGAMYVNSSSDVCIEKSIFKNNNAFKGSVAFADDGIFENCLFEHNRSDTNYTIYAEYPGKNIKIKGCTFVQNTYPTGGYTLGGIPVVKNTILWNSGNELNSCGTVSNCIVKGALDPSWINCKSSNPGFVGTGTHPYQLAWYSPAINAGDTTLLDTTGQYRDLAGNLRLYNSVIDIGAYEFNRGRIYVDKDALGDNNGSCWAHAFTDLQSALAEAKAYDTILVAEGTYYPSEGSYPFTPFLIDSLNSNITLLGGFSGIETSVSQRDWIKNRTVLSGNIGSKSDFRDNSMNVLVLNRCHNVIIEGFTISDGYASLYNPSGAAIAGSCYNVSIRNCVIENNRSEFGSAGCYMTNSHNVEYVNCIFKNNHCFNNFSITGQPPTGALLFADNSTANITSCSFFNNSADSGYSSAFNAKQSIVKVTNSSFFKNKISGNANKTMVFQSAKANVANCIFWNSDTTQEIILESSSSCTLSHCDIKGRMSAVEVVSGNLSIDTSKIWEFNPLFLDTSNGDLRISKSSPCIDKGKSVNDSGWNKDYYGSSRVINGKVDLGAFEFNGEVQPKPPVFLATLNRFTIKSGDSITIDLDKKYPDGRGYYVSYEFRDISQLTWQANCLMPDSSVKISIDPVQNILTVFVSNDIRPDSSFTIKLKAADPVYPQACTEKNIIFTTVSPGFNICSVTITQNDTGRDFSGEIRAGRTIDPIYLSQDRIYIYNKAGGDASALNTAKLPYITNISISENAPPQSRGGTEECGKYKFNFNALTANVYNYNGLISGKSLYAWMNDSSTPAGAAYIRDHKFRLILPITNGYDGVKNIETEVFADFRGPLPKNFCVKSNPHSQQLTWDPFTETLKHLTLLRINGSDTLVVSFHPDSLWKTTWFSDSLLDSEEYTYKLIAEDNSGNIASAEVRGTTPSDIYSIRGRVQGISLPLHQYATVQLFQEKDSAYVMIKDTTLTIDSSYEFKNLVNGNYKVRVVKSRYYSIPVELPAIVWRSSLNDMDFLITPEPVVDSNAVLVTQLPGSGDLRFTVKTKTLFENENPSLLKLKWVSGMYDTTADSQYIPVTSYTTTNNTDGSAIWNIVVSRSIIRDSILNRTRSFDTDIRYTGSSIVTEVSPYYTSFREAGWSYPSAMDSMVLFAAQSFTKPSKPVVSLPLVSESDVSFSIHDTTPWLNSEAVVTCTQIAGPQIETRTFDLSNCSFNTGTEIYRDLNWNYSVNTGIDNTGRSIVNSHKLWKDSTLSSAVTFIPDTPWISGKPADTSVYASWAIDVPENGAYWVWVYVDKKAGANSTAFVSFGNVSDTGKNIFKIDGKTEKKWVALYTGSIDRDDRPYLKNSYPVLNKGRTKVNLFFPSQPANVSAILLKLAKGSKPKEKNLPAPELIPMYGVNGLPAKASGFGLSPDAQYSVKTYIRDRYGNVSDTVIDTIQTQTDYYNGKITMYQKPGNGDLIMTYPVSERTDSTNLSRIILDFDSTVQIINVNQNLSKLQPNEIIIPKKSISESLLLDSSFFRRAKYDPALIELKNYYTLTKKTVKIVDCIIGKCKPTFNPSEYDIVNTISGTLKIFAGSLINVPIVRHECIDYDTILYTISSQSPIYWPPKISDMVASQEYRNPPVPVVNVTSVSSDKILMECNNLNTDSSGNRSQMAGTLYVTWKPGSECEESTTVSIPFGNKFEVQSNWIAFKPMFENAINSKVGGWRNTTSPVNYFKHQWLDRFDSTGVSIGGEFYPDIGDSITASDISGGVIIPSVSFNFRIDSTQMSADSSTGELYKIWFLPGGYNGVSNSEIYWTINDTVPVASQTASVLNLDSFSIDWVPGPSIFLDSGNHTFNLFMKDDGVKIAGIALSKENTVPQFDLSSLPKWSTKGFDLKIIAQGLQPENAINFTFEAVDRFGNRSGKSQKIERTKKSPYVIPPVVIAPDEPLQNGFYPSIYPSFSIGMQSETDDSLELSLSLIKTINGLSSPQTNMTLTRISGNSWSASVDSGSPLDEFPVDTALSKDNGYSILARAYKIINASDTAFGKYTKLIFGVVPDTDQVPLQVVIDTTIYEVPKLRFNFERGTELNGNTIIGDLQVLFDFDTEYSGTKLMLEDAIITTDTATDGFGVKHHLRITNVTGGTFGSYECSGYDDLCTRTQEFQIPYGKFSISVNPDSITRYTTPVQRLVVSGAEIIDDKGVRCKISGDSLWTIPVPVTRFGVHDTFYVKDGYFFIKNALIWSSLHDGFNIKGCLTRFNRTPDSSPTDTFTITACGACKDCGPFLNFNVKSPVYLDDEFTGTDERLENPVILRYTNVEDPYIISFTSDTVNQIVSSELHSVTYRGWQLLINSYHFTNHGAVITDFNVIPNTETFPEDKNPDRYTFSGLQIIGDTVFNGGALHLRGTATCNSMVSFRTGNDYVISHGSECDFIPVDENRDYILTFPSNGILALPSAKSPATDIYNEKDTIKLALSAFRVTKDGIDTIFAQDEFFRTLGMLDEINYGMKIEGIMKVGYAARDFQLDVQPKTAVPLLLFNKGFLNEDTVGVGQSSIGLFSDLSINTLYGKKKFNCVITPDGFDGLLELPGTGIDVINTSSGVRVMLLAPKFNLGEFSGEGESFSDIYNATFDCSRKLTGLSGKIILPEKFRKLSNASGLKAFAEKIIDVEVDEIYLGYTKRLPDNTEFRIGASSSIILGSAFNNIGLNGEKIILDTLTFAYNIDQETDKGKWSLDKLNGRAFTLPRSFGIGPRNVRDRDGIDIESLKKDYDANKKYIEFVSGGNGLEVDYRQDENFSIEMNNWSVKTTDDFPIEDMRGISLELKEFRYEKDFQSDKGKITKFVASAKYKPKNNKLGFPKFALLGDNSDSLYLEVGTEDEDKENKTNSNGFFAIHFTRIKIGDSIFNVGCGTSEPAYLKIYFDGTISLNTCLHYMDTISIYPMFSDEPEIFSPPPAGGHEFKINITAGPADKAVTVEANVNIKSKTDIDIIKKPLDANGSIKLGLGSDGIKIHHIDATWNPDVDIFNKGPLTVHLGNVGVGFAEDINEVESIDIKGFKGSNFPDSNVFFIYGNATTTLKGDKDSPCQFESGASVGLFVRADRDFNRDDIALRFALNETGFDCVLAGFKFGGDLVFSRDSIGFSYAYLDMSQLLEYGLIKEGGEKPDNLKKISMKAGLELYECYWKKDTTGDWNFHKPKPKICFNTEKGFDLLGVRVVGDLKFDELFSERPRIGYENIALKLSKNLGGQEIPTGLSLYIDNRRPYLHAEYNKPQKLQVALKGITLTDKLALGTALMEIGVDKDTLSGEDAWYFRGKSTMNLKGAIKELSVDLAFERPNPWKNTTGIRHAKVTIKLDSCARIPIGTTPFYISGFFGALYDGEGMPEGAIACGVPNLPAGLKLEAAVFIEFKKPDVVNGSLGFWVQLNALNLGLNGEVKALSGVAKADACVALYNNGSAFHGHFRVTAEKGLAIRGLFVVDIWSDESGGNFTSEAEAELGIKRATIIDRRWIKIPTKTKWFGGLFTMMGKFRNEKNGFATGVKILGKKFGLGVIGGKFSIGNMSKYKLKQAPISIAYSRMAMAKMRVGSPSDYTLLDPLIVLDSGEVISVMAAADSGAWEWPDKSLLFAKMDGSNEIWDENSEHYIFFDDCILDTNGIPYDEQENTLARMWVNTSAWDTVKLVAPTLPGDKYKFQYTLFASLPAPVCSLTVDTVSSTDGTLLKFSGFVENFQKAIKSIPIIDSTTRDSVDCLLKQRMRLKLYAVQIDSTKNDTGKTAYINSFKELPMDGFSGYQKGQKSIDENPGIDYFINDKRLKISNLTFKADHFLNGKYGIAAAIEILDYVIEDGRDGKVVLSDTDEDSVAVFRDNMVILGKTTSDTLIGQFKFNRPIVAPQDFSATGSPVSSNWNGKDERRTIFLRWKPDDNPSLSGYRITWWPTGDTISSRKSTAYAGSADGVYEIKIPDISQFYDDVCDTSGDSTGIAKACGDYLDPVPYRSNSFDISITPVIDSSYYDNDTNWRETNSIRYNVLRSKYLSIETLTVFKNNVALGVSNGTIRNPFKLVKTADTVKVPLNESGQAKLDLMVNRSVISPKDASDYGEIYVKLAGYENNAIPDSLRRRLPGVGALDNYLALDTNVIPVVVSLTPNDRDWTCKEMYSSTCTKVLMDSTDNSAGIENSCNCTMNEGTDPHTDSLGWTYDPNYWHNKRPKNSPCNGMPDSLIRGKTSIGLYKLYLYAINNGRRGRIVPNDSASIYWPVIYDSLFFRVVPAKPVIHDAKPRYVLNNINDTLFINVSDIDTSSYRPVIRMRYDGRTVDSVNYRFTSTRDWKGSKDVDKTTSADLVMIMPYHFNESAINDTSTIMLTVVNRMSGPLGGVVETESDPVPVSFVFNTANIQCPGNYGSDSTNSQFVMEWIGKFPRNPAEGDTITVLFTELHDRKKSSYNLKLKHYNGLSADDTIPINSFWIEDNSIKFRLPPDVNSCDTCWELITRYEDSIARNCMGIDWGNGQRFSVREQQIPNIIATGNGAILNGIDPRLYRICWFIGINPGIWPNQLCDGSDTGFISLDHSDWVTVRVSDRDGNNQRTYVKWIEIDDSPLLVYPNGDTVPDNFIAYPGDTVMILKRQPSLKRISAPVRVYSSKFGNGPETLGQDIFVLSSETRSPLLLTVRNYTTDSSGSKKVFTGRSSLYNFTVQLPANTQPITIPSPRIMEAAGFEQKGYPLLVRLDSTLIDSIDAALSGNFHFRSASMKPLVHEIEKIDSVNQIVNVWVKLDSIDPAIGNNTIYFVPGTPSRFPPANVWSEPNFTAVYHCNSDGGVMKDATSRAEIPLISGDSLTNGVVAAGIKFTSAAHQSFRSPVSSNNTGITMSCWINISDSSMIPDSGIDLFSYYKGNTKKILSFGVLPDAGLFITVNNDTLRTLSGVAEPGTWLHCAARYGWSFGEGDAVIFVNGVAVATGRFNDDGPEYGISGSFYYGTNRDGTPFPGKIDEIRVIPSQLSSSWISLDWYTQRKLNDFLTPVKNITSVTTISNPEIRMQPNAGDGDFFFTDNQITAEGLPSNYQGRTWVKMPSHSAVSKADTMFTLGLSGPAELAVMIDNRMIPNPPFITSLWSKKDSAYVKTPDGEIFGCSIYERSITSACTLSFSGPKAGGSGNGFGYALLIDLSQKRFEHNVDLISGSSPVKMRNDISRGDLLFFDREYVIDSLPSGLRNSALLSPSNSFKHDTSSNYLSFTLKNRSVLKLLADTMINDSLLPELPNKETWKAGSEVVRAGSKMFKVHEATIRAGNVKLSGPHYDTAFGNINSYAVFVKSNRDTCLVVDVWPAAYERMCGGVDLGVEIYSDTNLRIDYLSEKFKGMTLIRTPQSEYTNSSAKAFGFTLNRPAWVYYAVDTVFSDTTVPSFLNDGDEKSGYWTPTRYTLINSIGKQYQIWKKFYKDGELSFSGVRFGKELSNKFNYVFMAGEIKVDTLFKNDSIPFDDTTIRIENDPIGYSTGPVKLMSKDCENINIGQYEMPVRVYLAMDPNFPVEGSFLEEQFWTRTDEILQFNKLLPDFIFWTKDFPANMKIVIPGIHCNGYKKGVYNPVARILPLDFPVYNYHARDLEVVGFGDERGAGSDSYLLKKLDISYAWDIGMRSNSWVVNVNMTGGRAAGDDTISILSAFVDTVLKWDSAYVDTTIEISDTFSLSDLVPVMVNADSVMVKATDLSAEGYVRVAFTNRSDRNVAVPFVVLLFEDLNGDYHYNSNDRYLGSTTIEDIEPNEYAVYDIHIRGEISFPKRAIFAFVDADQYVTELDEWNNVRSSGTSCENVTVPQYFEEIDSTGMVGEWGSVDSLTDSLPAIRDTTVFCYIKDFNGDSLIDYNDTLCILYTNNYRLHAVNALTLDSLFTSIFVGPSAVNKIKVEDLTNDGIPEIIAGDVIYSNTGVMLWNGGSFTDVASRNFASSTRFDINKDGDPDSVEYNVSDSCVAVFSGRDSSLLYVNPFSRWTGMISGGTVGMLANVTEGVYHCYDVNISFPRYSVTATDTVDLTVRVANAGAYQVNGVKLEIFADTVDRDSSIVDGIAELPSGVTFIGESRTLALNSDSYVDMQGQAVIPGNVKRIWFRINGDRKYFECNEKDGVLNMRIR